MYKVIHKFKDLQDGNHIYEVGDIYPREGKRVSIERAVELLGDENKIGKPLIVEETIEETVEEPAEEEEIEEEKKPARKKRK